MSADDLKRELLRRAKDRGLDYALVVRRVGAGAEASLVEMMQQMAAGEGSAPSLAEVYELDADGHEEPLRGLHISDLSPEAFKEIIATGETPVVYSDQLPPAMNSIFSMGFSPGEELPTVSCVTPSLLLEEVSLAKSEGPSRRHRCYLLHSPKRGNNETDFPSAPTGVLKTIGRAPGVNFRWPLRPQILSVWRTRNSRAGLAPWQAMLAPKTGACSLESAD
jgi:hypothetical protein